MKRLCTVPPAVRVLRGLGEQRAFEEWLPEVPNLEFEFLFYRSIGHFYTRVHHRN